MKHIAIITALLFFAQLVKGMDFIKAALSKLATQQQPSYIIPKECEYLVSFKQNIEALTKENMTTEDIQIIAENFPRCSNLARKSIQSGTTKGLRATTVLTFGKTISHTRTHGVLIFNNITTEQPDSCTYIYLLSVKKECQKKGVGTKLLTSLESYPHVSRISLDATTESIPFYQKNGFTIVNKYQCMQKNIKR